MRILLDECIDWRLTRELSGHDVRTVHTMGWAGIKNGELLSLAANRFDVFITLDSNLPYQQTIGRLQIAVALLRPKTSRLSDIRSLIPELLDALPLMTPGNIKQIGR
ncbi:DUF5615 family PIN-like protein [Pseudorhodoplanes sinuspersici]|uniref:Uncharacterized protein n=1 Tax=Pseudorhodoplanes sinuspersici TaxID=1235591 RepID=A0A1W6ZS14_9HYPH|nr:DUF5615 family PIN-like protein [Pseudorhodoplanes sinuspersici]ARQ00174.1 hypothetical protein CAK95_14625 [Pseudorhodoplanes sinuspersici]RKE67692.1 hypothetical protein DFP91_5460 [Pseudorhodoplanes sinuspersici]